MFLKYTPREGTRIKKGMRLVFYKSRSGRKVLGEAEVKTVGLMTAADALDKYGHRLMLREEELWDYSNKRGNRRDKRMLLLELEKVKVYRKPKVLDSDLTMGGQYLEKRAYDKLLAG